DLEAVRTLLDEIAPDLTTQPVNARFIFNDETRQLEVLERSVNGRALDVEGTLAQFEAALFATDPAERRVQLAFVDLPPDIPDTATAAELGITELVVEKSTYY